jgi:hypothetical protein
LKLWQQNRQKFETLATKSSKMLNFGNKIVENFKLWQKKSSKMLNFGNETVENLKLWQKKSSKFENFANKTIKIKKFTNHCIELHSTKKKPKVNNMMEKNKADISAITKLWLHKVTVHGDC